MEMTIIIRKNHMNLMQNMKMLAGHLIGGRFKNIYKHNIKRIMMI